MLRPLLIIGVGGSGGKTIRSMKQALNRRLESARYKSGIPAAWQFLQIDTTYDGVDFPAPMLPQDEVHLVVPSGASFDSILANITSQGTLHEQQKMMSGWGIPSSAISISMGAGQTRAIGRQVGIADSANTLRAIQASIAKLKTPTALSDLGSVAKALGAGNPTKDPQAFIVSSLAGGTGAGMFFDIAELIKRATTDQWAQEAISFLYTAEVFSSLKAAGKDVSKNSLGAMNELIASKWVGVSDRSELIYSKLGLASSANAPKREYGCKGNILIGTQNKSGTDISIGADGAGMNEVFLTVGEALAGILTDDDISEHIFKKAFVNITQTQGAIDNSGLAPEKPQNPTFAAAGMGFGQLTLGADRIVDYVADALTKRQVEKLLWPELSPSLLKGGASTKSLIQKKSDEIWPNFLLDSGLDEKGNQDQILNALYSKNWNSEVKQFVTGIVKKSVSEKAIPLGKFAQGVWSEWETDASEFLKDSRDKINSRARAWVPEIQEKIREQIGTELTQSGYAVLTNLVARLSEELAQHSLGELKREHESLALAVQGFNQVAFNNRVQEISDGLTGISSQNSAFLEKLRLDLSRVLERQIQSYVHDLAASLVQDLLNFFLAPLTENLVNARFNLQKQQKAVIFPNGFKNPYTNFPDWASGIVPSRYNPRTIERILIEPTQYESNYELYSEKDSGDNPPFQLSINFALLGKKMNPMPGDLNLQNLVTVGSSWITSVRDAQNQVGAAVSKLQWNFETDLVKLAERNRRWLKDEDSSFGKFTNMSIREFVSAPSETPDVRDKREDKFVKEFQAMLLLSQPLVLLNAQAMNYAIGTDGKPADQIITKSSKIPFDANSPIGQSCQNVLKNNGVDLNDPGFIKNWFEASSNDTTMFATSTTQASLPAWAFASLTEPILNQVAESKNDAGTWIQFWEGRRTRPLIEAVPFETEIRRSIITGWFISSLFGMREVETQATGRTVRIWNPTLQNPGHSSFPSPLLVSHIEDIRRDWVLPSLLTSAGLALAEFGKTGNAQFIQGYQLLKYLGREVTTGISNNRDKWDANGVGDLLPTGMRKQSTYLKDWISSGAKPAPNLDLLKLLQANLTENSDRGHALAATVQQIRNEYNNVWSEFSSVVWHKLPETWELKEDIDLALGDILSYVNDTDIKFTTTSDAS